MIPQTLQTKSRETDEGARQNTNLYNRSSVRVSLVSNQNAEYICLARSLQELLVADNADFGEPEFLRGSHHRSDGPIYDELVWT